MRYKKFTVENYKGISRVEINFDSNRILTLVGLNESGKTTILEAISLFYTLVKRGVLSPSQLNAIRPKGINFSGKVTISAELELETQDKTEIERHHTETGKRTKLKIPDSYIYSFEFVYKTHTYKYTNKSVSFPIKTISSKRLLFDTDKKHWQELVRFIRINLTPEILFYEDFIFQIPEKVVFLKSPNPDQSDSESDDEKNQQWQFVLDDILRSVDSEFSSFQEFVVKIWDSDNDTAMNRISSMEMLLNKKITQGWKDLFKEKTKKSEKLNFKEIRLIATPSTDRLNFSFKVKNDSGKEFQINERSKGFKWFFAFLIFTEFRKNRSRNILFLLDEPASNLHSSAQQKILEAIEQLSNGSTVIYSTHSHHLINPVWLNGAHIVVNESMSEEKLIGDFTEDSGASEITAQRYYNFVARSGSSVKTVFFQPILERLDYAPSQVEPVPGIAITEGKYDWYTYKYFFEVLLNKKGLNLYPGAGCGQHWDIIRLYLAWGKDFILMLDSDSPGLTAKTKYEDEFTGFVENKIFTYLDVFNEKLQTEDLIEDVDKKILCDSAFVKGTYDGVKSDKKALKSKLNFAINQLLISKTKIKLGKETLDRFRKLYKFLNSKN